MRDCPQCSRAVDGLICPQCGYRDPSYTTIADDAPGHPLCCHFDRGLRCANPGTISDGPADRDHRYCAAHYPRFRDYGYDGVPKGPPATPPLTDQQWYNVCRLRPNVAKRAAAYTGRPLADVGPHNPLHATSTLGPMMVNVIPADDDVEARLEREAIRAESLNRALRDSGDVRT